MKKILYIIPIFVIMLLCASKQCEARKIYKGKLNVKPALHSVKLDWKVPKKAKNKIDYYVVYKTNVTKLVKEGIKRHKSRLKEPKLKVYKKCKKVNNNTFSYDKKKLKKNHGYSFIVKGFSKKSGKDKLVYQSKYGNAYTGLMPVLVEEYVEDYVGLTEDGAKLDYNDYYLSNVKRIKYNKLVLYQKLKGNKYKKVDKLNSKQLNDKYSLYALYSSKLKKGKTYYFRYKSYGKVDGKKISCYSPSFHYKTFKDKANIKISSITKPSLTDNIVLKITSASRYNGLLRFSNKYYDKTCRFVCYNKDKTIEESSYFEISMYSYDNITWYNMTKKALELKPNKSIYLKFVFFEDEYDDNLNLIKRSINYLGDSASKCYFDFDEIDSRTYRTSSPRADWTCMYFDIVKGTGYAYNEIEGI